MTQVYITCIGRRKSSSRSVKSQQNVPGGVSEHYLYCFGVSRRRNGAAGLVKVGFTRNLKSRLREHVALNGLPSSTRYHKTWPLGRMRRADAFHCEAVLHRVLRLRFDQHRPEWYEADARAVRLEIDRFIDLYLQPDYMAGTA